MIRKPSIIGTEKGPKQAFFHSFSKDLLNSYCVLEVQDVRPYFKLHQITVDLLSINIFYRLYTLCDLKVDWKCQNVTALVFLLLLFYCLNFNLKIRYYDLLPVTLKYVLLLFLTQSN